MGVQLHRGFSYLAGLGDSRSLQATSSSSARCETGRRVHNLCYNGAQGRKEDGRREILDYLVVSKALATSCNRSSGA